MPGAYRQNPLLPPIAPHELFHCSSSAVLLPGAAETITQLRVIASTNHRHTNAPPPPILSPNLHPAPLLSRRCRPTIPPLLLSSLRSPHVYLTLGRPPSAVAAVVATSISIIGTLSISHHPAHSPHQLLLNYTAATFSDLASTTHSFVSIAHTAPARKDLERPTSPRLHLHRHYVLHLSSHPAALLIAPPSAARHPTALPSVRPPEGGSHSFLTIKKR